MRRNKEERYQIKLTRLLKQVSRGRIVASYERTFYEGSEHQFRVFNHDGSYFIVFHTGLLSAKSCYEWAVAECKKKGLIR